jgi:hypothetical protein
MGISNKAIPVQIDRWDAIRVRLLATSTLVESNLVSYIYIYIYNIYMVVPN